MVIPVIDIFAGPGGLSEGFSSVLDGRKKRLFDIRLSIEKDNYAHETLTLRSFYRKFPVEEAPPDYYDILKSSKITERRKLMKFAFEQHKDEGEEAQQEAWKAELGSKKHPKEEVDEKIKRALGNNTEWLLIGGPPCQAYSLVGRSRVGGIKENDHRVHLYKEYLRIIAKHHPTAFVMENVKGLFSAKLNGESIFNKILEDLKSPSTVFKGFNAPNYKIYSFTTAPDDLDKNGFPIYKNPKDYLIRSEEYGIPQKRHRVILLGVREDVNYEYQSLEKKEAIPLEKVIGDMPPIRSGLNRRIKKTKIVDGKRKREYENVKDSSKNWYKCINRYKKEIFSYNGLEERLDIEEIVAPSNKIGSEYITANGSSGKSNPLFSWYNDNKFKGHSNHISRSHLLGDLKRYLFASMFTKVHGDFPRLKDYLDHSEDLLPDHKNAQSGKFVDRFRVQLPNQPATTITSHISKDGHYFIHYDPKQCRSLTVREAARIQTFPDNYLFCGPRTAQYHQVGNAVPPYLAFQIAECIKSIFGLYDEETIK